MLSVKIYTFSTADSDYLTLVAKPDDEGVMPDSKIAHDIKDRTNWSVLLQIQWRPSLLLVRSLHVLHTTNIDHR